mgnify:CR=1 FL=1
MMSKVTYTMESRRIKRTRTRKARLGRANIRRTITERTRVRGPIPRCNMETRVTE